MGTDNLNLFERAFPRWARKREAEKQALLQLRKYDAASKGRRTAGWVTSSASAKTEIESGIQTIRNRSRDLVRNNPWAAKGMHVIRSNVVGHGIEANIVSKNKRKTEKAQADWQTWAMSTDCDAEGVLNFDGLVGLMVETMVQSGACIVLREIEPSLDFPLVIRVLEPDHLDTSKDGTVEGKKTIRGMEFDARGRVAAYWLFPEHPGDRYVSYRDVAKSVRVPAERVAYLFRKDRPGQVDGVPWMAPVMIRLRDIEDAADARLMQQKIAACFAAFVVDPNADAKPGSSPATESIEPGTIEYLGVGRDVRFANPPSVTGYAEYMSFELHAVSAGLGITFESLTGMLDKVNFSSGRMGWLEMSRNIDTWRWQTLIPCALDRVWHWYQQIRGVTGDDLSGFSVEWTPPRRELIDPAKEVPALIDAIRAGIMTLPEVQRTFGFNPYRMLEEMQEYNAAMDKAGVIVDTDPRQRDQGGKAIQSDASGPVDEAIRALALSQIRDCE